MSVVAVERAMVMLKLMSKTPEGISVRAVAREFGYSPGVVQKSLQALTIQGFAEQDPVTQLYKLGPEAVAVGLIALRSLDVRAAARPVLEWLAATTRETALLGVPRGDVAVYIDQVSSPQEVRMNVPIGDPRPFNCTAVGKVLLAAKPGAEFQRLLDSGAFSTPTDNSISEPDELHEELKRVRDQGYGLDQEEFILGVRCVGAPIRDFDGSVVAAVAIAGPVERMMAREDLTIEQVLSAAEQITSALGAKSLPAMSTSAEMGDSDS